MFVKLLKLLLVIALMTSCATRSKTILVPTKPTPCRVSTFPVDPLIEFSAECPISAVCLTDASAISLGIWIRSVIRYHNDVNACPLVKEI